MSAVKTKKSKTKQRSYLKHFETIHNLHATNIILNSKIIVMIKALLLIVLILRIKFVFAITFN